MTVPFDLGILLPFNRGEPELIGTNGKECLFANSTICITSSVEDGQTTNDGSSLVLASLLPKYCSSNSCLLVTLSEPTRLGINCGQKRMEETELNGFIHSIKPMMVLYLLAPPIQMSGVNI